MACLTDFLKEAGCLESLSDQCYKDVAAELLCQMKNLLENLGAKQVIPQCFSRVDGAVDPTTGLVVSPGYIVVDITSGTPEETWYVMGGVEIDPSEYKISKCC